MSDNLAPRVRFVTLQAGPFLGVHMLCTEKRLCTNRVKFLLSMLSALLRYSFEPRRFPPRVKCKQREKRVVEKNLEVVHPTLGSQTLFLSPISSKSD